MKTPRPRAFKPPHTYTFKIKSLEFIDFSKIDNLSRISYMERYYSPIETLPREMMGEILQLALDASFYDAVASDDENNCSTAVRQVERAQTRLLCISSEFRAAAFSSPGFWRTAVIRLREGGSLPENIINFNVLDMAGVLSLRVLCHIEFADPPHASDCMNALFEILPRYLRRASSIVLYIPNSSAVLHDPRWLDGLQEDNVMEVRLRLWLSSMDHEMHPLWLSRLIQLPSLRHLTHTLSCRSHPPTYLDCVSVSPHLTYLSVGRMIRSWILSVLKTAPMLEELRADSIFEPFGAEPDEPVTHERLRVLRIIDPADNVIAGYVTLPSLEVLELAPFRVFGSNSIWPGNEDLDFFRTHKDSLRRLILWHGNFHESIVSIISMLTQLEELSFHHLPLHGNMMGFRPSLPDQVLEHLAGPSLPRLASLSLVVYEPQLPLLATVIENRTERYRSPSSPSASVAPLAFVGITLWNEGSIIMAPGDPGRYLDAGMYWERRRSGGESDRYMRRVLKNAEVFMGTDVFFTYQGYATSPVDKRLSLGLMGGGY
ncbi:hypothetical protein CYLTODRAFT_415339 [Cylindrobasidium torrendii FP15055 ss-10]|uniref:F-box domain-containing protein n=1 Tax=Cylindrobasidium torrendii FP15055 ss-10 TaxID=1314674 RepID=A0A0D7AU98_9AGAR|nr:hypothetical protein CYLTODRAFT_415339 [Cylindrobasidium torrendii FP15055 ss-10]